MSTQQQSRAVDWEPVLREINGAMGSIGEEERLFGSIVESLKDVVRFDRASIAIYEPTERAFVVQLVNEDPFSSVLGTNEIVPYDDAGSIRWVFDRRKPRADYYSDDEVPSTGIDKKLYAEGFRSLLSVPLLVQGRIIGTFNIGTKTPIRFSEGTIETLSTVASCIAIAVEHTRASEQIRLLKERLRHDSHRFRDEIDRWSVEEPIGKSDRFKHALRRARLVAPTDLTVLITGETGTGKELIAGTIHRQSRRNDRPLITVNCAALPRELIESELFGHEKGAFTGAIVRKIGRFELADRGTIFLDEICDMPSDAQAKLLRVLQERQFERVGGTKTRETDVRVIAATNRNLEEAMAKGKFRKDLFYRLNVFPIHCAPLRDRKADIPVLARHFVDKHARRMGKSIGEIPPHTMQQLLSYDWPGNVRELENIVQRALLTSAGPALDLNGMLPDPPSPTASPNPTDKQGNGEAGYGQSGHARSGHAQSGHSGEGHGEDAESLEDLERRHIGKVLRRTNGIIAGPKGAARILKIHPNTLRSRIKKLGIFEKPHEIS